MSRSKVHLFGCPTLFDGSGAPISGGAAQRHRIALLAQVAVAYPNVVSRDRLVGMLWPDRDGPSARRLLNVAIAVLRQSLGAEAIMSVGDDLRLGVALIETDVHQFQHALDEGRLEEAVEFSHGVFLEGFYLDNAEEFDRWMETQRLRFARRYTDALTVLAERATSAGNFTNAAGWWRALSHAEPSNTNAVLRLFDALESTGDITGALAVEEAHTAHMRSEFGVEPDARVSARGAALRKSLTEAKLDRPLPRVVAVKTPPETTPFVVPNASWKRPALTIAAGAVLMVGAAFAFFDRVNAMRRADKPPALVTAILPITLPAGVPNEFGDQVADLLKLNLGQVEGLSFVRPDTAQARVYEQSMENNVRRASTLNASMVVAGRISRAGSELTATFSVIDSIGNLIGAVNTTVPNDAKVVPALVDAATVDLMRVLWGHRWRIPEPRIASVTTKSLPALRLYLQGEAAFRRLHYDSAAVALQSAVDIDTTFALAYFRLGEVNAYRLGTVNVIQPMERAERLSDRLPPREAAVLKMWLMHERKKTAAYNAAAQIARDYPGDPDALFAIADIALHAHAQRDTPPDSLYLFWDRAIDADRLSLRPLAHVVEMSTGDDTPERFDHYLAELNRREGAPPPVFYATVRLMRWGKLPAARDSFAAIVKAPPMLTNYGGLLQVALNALTRRTFDGTEDSDFSTAEWIISHVRRTLASDSKKIPSDSRTRDALTYGVGRMTRPPDEFIHGSVNQPAIPTTEAIAFGYAPQSLAAAADAKLAERGGHKWQVSLLRAELALARSDTITARVHLDSAIAFESQPVSPGSADKKAYMHGFNRALNGWILSIAGDTARAISEMRTGILDGGYGEAGMWSNALIKKLNGLMAAWPETRNRGIARLRTSIVFEDAYWPWTRYQLAQALDARGDHEEAAQQYRRFAMLWKNADPDLRHYADDANKRAEQLIPKRE